ncbi:ParB/RepB/Spo0J family partition protein [Streptomyces sp. NPDC086783]|uniref:ParB/RepB/Spo0J family partition protein n=1 Tax=Streptomyces sp. NPDC086783 TaxID=3365758 RepID=UPI003810B5AC
MSAISLNPDNPRTHLGDLSDLAGSLRDHGQKQALTVMNRDAYIRANPDHERDLEANTAYVVVDGSSRLAAAREAGLSTVRVMVSDDQGNSADELLESALVANIHRQDLAELDEARALERLLAIHGSQNALAKRLHRSQGWVSQRLALLKLTPDLQARIGEEPIELLRAVGNKPAHLQESALRKLKEEKARLGHVHSTGEGSRVKAQSSEPDLAVNAAQKPAAVSDVAPASAAIVAAKASSRDDAGPALSDTVPEPRAKKSRSVHDVADLSVADGIAIARYLINTMSDIEFTKMLHLLNDHQEQKVAARRTR